MLGRFALLLASNTPKNTSLGTVPNADTTFARPIFIASSLRLFRGQFAEPIGRRHPAIHEEVAAGAKPAVRTHEQCATFPTSSGVPVRPAAETSIMRRQRCDHRSPILTVRTAEPRSSTRLMNSWPMVADLAGRHRVVRSQIAAADTGARDANQGVGRLDEPGVENRLNAHICAPYITVARMLTLSFCGYWPYSSSLTLSIHSTTLPSSASAIAMCVMAVVGDAPCQCFSCGSNQTTSPGRISSIGPPSRCARP